MLFGLLGNPIGRSWSEVLFNKLFKMEENEHVYTAINISRSSIAHFMQNAPKYFDGLNVTIPYKEDVLMYVRDKDPLVWKAEVSNVIKREGEGFTAFNTDYFGLEQLFKSNSINLNGKRIAVAGSGGVSKILIFFIITNYSPDILHVFTRNQNDTEKRIVGTWQYDNLKIRSYDKVQQYDILINCTPLGMNSKDESPFHSGFFSTGSRAIDLTYQNNETNFMKIAIDKGGRGINGRDMFFSQAKESYRIFFDRNPEEKLFKRACEEVIQWSIENLR